MQFLHEKRQHLRSESLDPKLSSTREVTERPPACLQFVEGHSDALGGSETPHLCVVRLDRRLHCLLHLGIHEASCDAQRRVVLVQHFECSVDGRFGIACCDAVHDGADFGIGDGIDLFLRVEDSFQQVAEFYFELRGFLASLWIGDVRNELLLMLFVHGCVDLRSELEQRRHREPWSAAILVANKESVLFTNTWSGELSSVMD
mmetsp:Transcript_14832/g.41083  ORF Transcript_14832/g.41083 Transcript_14832/m.41083 type:complete len:203 (+) Transcript_14832:542-1150(+)